MANRTVQENQQAGDPQSGWDLGEPNATNIEGFATDISVNCGQTVSFKINTDSTNYRIDVYRLGFYDRLGARRVATSVAPGGPGGTVDILGMPSVQPPPVTDPSTGLVDAGNWSISASWAVPATAVSGVYLAKMTRQDGISGQSHMVFIVRDDGNAHDIVFQTSDATWHAYNGWGGFNLYGGGAGLSNDGRAVKVSYNRPFGTRDRVGTNAGPQSFLFGVEIAAIRWLEANGYDVCYLAGVDTDRYGAGSTSQLLNKKVFLSVGHDEYWSGQQRANVEAARAAGVHLAFWSGNEAFWKTRYEASAVTTDGSPSAYRTLVCYKETRENRKLDPTPSWTGTWRDPRFSPPADGGRPENALTGTLFQVDAWQADAIRVPYPMSTLRFWRHCPLANPAPGGSTTLVQNLLGYEWDEAPDNGCQPAGLMRLSATTLPVDHYLLDYGKMVGPATATHHLTLYRHSSGALVFGAGTVFWAWGLDANHDLTATPTDPNVQQATVNLLADMGVPPGSLQAGLTYSGPSSDAVSPVSAIASPAAGVSLTQGQTVAITGTASDSGGQVGGVEVSTDGGDTWHPVTSGTTDWSYTWTPATLGSVTLRSRAVDDSLNLEVSGPGVTVTVVADPNLPVSLFSPNARPFVFMTQDANAVELGVKFQTSVAGAVRALRFYKSNQADSSRADYNPGPHVGHLWDGSGRLLATAPFSHESFSGWQQVELENAIPLMAGATYVASYHTAQGVYSSDSSTNPGSLNFSDAHTSGPLTALDTASSNGNGVFAYGDASSFPLQSFDAANYWVDIVFVPGPNGA